ncbi:MAG: cytochrome c [Rhodospirillaceae bacterium]
MRNGSLRRIVFSLAICGAFIPFTASADDKDAIEYRQHVMRSLDAQTAVLGMILSGAIPEDNLVSHLDTIALIAQSSLATFETKIPGGESDPKVWGQWADFSARMKAFAEGTAKVAKMAKEQGKDSIMSELASALTCKGCHDVYRVKK